MYQLLNGGNIPFVSDMSDFTEVDDAIGRRLDREKILPPKYEDGELWKVLQKACEFKKKDRYQEAKEFREALEKLKGDQKREHGEKRRNLVKEEKQTPENDDLKVAKNIEKQYNEGESVWFGSYPQTKNGDKKPIEWLILKKEKNKALLLSKYILDAERYHKKFKNVTWQTSDVRSWLNDKFYKSAFNNMEQKKIQDVLIKTENNPSYGTHGGSTTKDKVFLLSIDEAEELISNDEIRKAEATEYAKKTGVYVNDKTGGTLWWLRSPGYDGEHAAGVDFRGWVYTDGYGIDSSYEGIRPAIWVSLEE